MDEVDPQRWAQGWRLRILAAGMLVYPFVTASGIAQYTNSPVGYAIVAAFCVCYVLAAVAVRELAWVRFWSLIGVMTVLFIATMPFAHAEAFYLWAVVVSLALIHLKRFVLPLLALSMVISIVVPWAIPSWHSGPGWTQAIAVTFTVLACYGFAETARANRALIEARAEIAQLAADAERNRIARDLHDLLGHSLTAITVKSDLAGRLAETDPPRSAQEIAEVETLSRQALADVRAAVSGFRDVSLARELARGRELLRASGVTADLPTAVDMIDATRQELFGWAVREGLTNVARHARATHCTVTLSASEVEIRDDGVGGPASFGNGLAGLKERVTAAGGTVDAGPLSPTGWRLKVSLPVIGLP